MHPYRSVVSQVQPTGPRSAHIVSHVGTDGPPWTMYAQQKWLSARIIEGCVIISVPYAANPEVGVKHFSHQRNVSRYLHLRP